MNAGRNDPGHWKPDPLWWREQTGPHSGEVGYSRPEASADATPRPSHGGEPSGTTNPAAPPPGWYPGPAHSRFYWWDGSAWTGASAPNTGGAPAPFRPKAVSQISPKMWILALAGLIALALLVGILFSALSRDEASYQAGYEQGSQYGRIYDSLTSDRRSDSQVSMDCSQFAARALNRDTNYYSGGELRGSAVDGDDYQDGCIEGFQAAVR